MPLTAIVLAAGDQSQDNSSKQWTYSFGDPSIVVDRNNPQNVLVMCVGGHTSFFASKYEEPQHVVRLLSTDGGQTWSKDSLTYQIYNLTKNSVGGKTYGLFLTSGKIMHSGIADELHAPEAKDYGIIDDVLKP